MNNRIPFAFADGDFCFYALAHFFRRKQNRNFGYDGNQQRNWNTQLVLVEHMKEKREYPFNGKKHVSASWL
jgi:hypothetical protein